MTSRLETLAKIDNLLQECYPDEKQLIALGKQLQGDREERLQKIVDKAEDMTTKEMLHLRKNGFTILKLSQATGINKEFVSQMLSDLEGNGAELLNKYEQAVLRNKNFNKYIKLKELGKAPKEMAEFLKVSISSIYKYSTIDNKRKNLGVELDESFDSISLKSNRESVREMYIQGYSEKFIAKELNLSTTTVHIYKYGHKETS